jgi:hypothetical protein
MCYQDCALEFLECPACGGVGVRSLFEQPTIKMKGVQQVRRRLTNDRSMKTPAKSRFMCALDDADRQQLLSKHMRRSPRPGSAVLAICTNLVALAGGAAADIKDEP